LSFSEETIIMLRTRYSAFASILFTIATLAVIDAPLHSAGPEDKIPAKEKEQKLIAVLRSNAPPQEKAITCKRLAVYGTKDAVPALAALLADEQLASWARIALEAIPDSAADVALRESLGKLHGKLLVGAINSIGVRRDAKATELLITRLKNADAEVASAAAVALGRIGTEEAAEALKQSLTSNFPEVRSAVAESCILCAETFQDNKKLFKSALSLYTAVRKADVPKQRILEATRGEILLCGESLLVEQLKSSDKSFFALGLQMVREYPREFETDFLVANRRDLPPDREALLILALGDRNESSVMPAIVKAARSGPDPVRLSAIGVLARRGDSTCVPDLLEIAEQAQGKLAEAAISALTNLPDKAADADLASRLSQAKGKMQLALIQLAGQRRIAAANPALHAAVENPDSQIRAAAITSLGQVVELENLPILIAQAAHPRTPEEAKAALEALAVACPRMSDRESCAEKLLAVLPSFSGESKCKFLNILGDVGGAKALAAVAAAAKDADPAVKDAASRLLGGWPTADAAPALLELAKSSAEQKYRVRALRGYLRIARQFVLPAEERTEMCRNALQAATREEEKKLVLEVLSRYSSIEMLKIALAAAKDPLLKDDATRHVFLIVQKIGGDSEDVRKLLVQAGFEPVKVEIVKAEYGEGTKFQDVTAAVRRGVGVFPMIVLRSPNYNTSFGGDPVPNKPKKLNIQYKINDRPGEVSLSENAAILLPMPK
jgi:HEAT repeat protein